MLLKKISTVQSLLFIGAGAGAGAGEKKFPEPEPVKTDLLLNTGASR